MVLWFGSRDVLTGTDVARHAWPVPASIRCFAAGALGALSEVWGELSQAAGAAERLTEILAEEPAISAPTNPEPLPR